MDQVAAYSHAIVSLALFAIVALLLNPWAAVERAKAGLVPGQMPEPNYSNRGYRIGRAYQNTVEMTGVFAAAIAVAVMAGASPFWVNLFASLVLISRLAMVFVHFQGIGRPNNGARTILFVFGWLMMLLIAIMVVGAAF